MEKKLTYDLDEYTRNALLLNIYNALCCNSNIRHKGIRLLTSVDTSCDNSTINELKIIPCNIDIADLYLDISIDKSVGVVFEATETIPGTLEWPTIKVTICDSTKNEFINESIKKVIRTSKLGYKHFYVEYEEDVDKYSFTTCTQLDYIEDIITALDIIDAIKEMVRKYYEETE